MNDFLPIEALAVVSLDEITNPGAVLRFGDFATGSFLIAGSDELYAISLDAEWSFSAMQIDHAGSWQGLYVKDTQIRVDPASAFDAAQVVAPLGSLVKSSSCLYILANADGSVGFPRRIKIPLSGKIDAQSFTRTAGFSKWSVGVVVDDEWHPLIAVDVKLK